MQVKYIKLVTGKTGHGYEVEQYTQNGEFVSNTTIALAEIDKKTNGKKLRLKTGNVWAIVTSHTFLPIGTPKFLR